MARRWIDFCEGTLNGAHNDSTTTISLTLASNSNPPTASAGLPLYLVIDPEGAEHDPEIVKCTGVTGSGPYSLTVVRAQEGSTEQAWDTARKVVAAVTATGMNDFPIAADAETIAGAWTFNTNVVLGSGITIDGLDPSGVEAGATADQTAAEIRALVDSATDSQVFTDADHTKLNGIEASATADQSASEILAAIKTVDGAGTGLDADLLDAQEGSYYLAAANITGATLASGVTASSLTSVGTLTAVNTAGAITFTAVTGTPTISGSGEVLRINARQFDIANEANSELLIQCNQNADVILYHDNIGRVATTSAGATLTGDVTVTGDVIVGDDIFLTTNVGLVSWNTGTERWYNYASGTQFWFNASLDSGSSYTSMVRYYRNANVLLNKADFLANVEPITDNTHDLGSSAKRWDDIWATNSTISTSDVSQKTDVADSALGLGFINDLRPVSFKFTGGGVRTHYGFIAQEVETTLGSAAASTALWINGEYRDEDGATQQGPQGLRQGELMAPLVKAVQELTARVVALEGA